MFEGTYNKGISIMDAFTQSFYIHVRLIFTISYELNSLVLDDEKNGWDHYRHSIIVAILRFYNGTSDNTHQRDTLSAV